MAVDHGHRLAAYASLRHKSRFLSEKSFVSDRNLVINRDRIADVGIDGIRPLVGRFSVKARDFIKYGLGILERKKRRVPHPGVA